MKNQLINTITETVNEQYKKKYKDFDAAYILGKAGEKAATNVQG
jgi:hypothetical protein